MKKLSCSALVCVALVGCQTHKIESAQTPSGVTSCPDVRPTICTREYAPVCAVLGSERVTYATACTACADERVSGYTAGACEEATNG